MIVETCIVPTPAPRIPYSGQIAVNDRRAPDIFEKPIASIDPGGLPPRGTPGFGQALTVRYALEYAGKGWTARIFWKSGTTLRFFAAAPSGRGHAYR